MPFGPRSLAPLSLVDDRCTFLLSQPLRRLPQLPGEIVTLTLHLGRAVGDGVDDAINLAGFRAHGAFEPRRGAFIDAAHYGWRVRRADGCMPRRGLSLQGCLPQKLNSVAMSMSGHWPGLSCHGSLVFSWTGWT
jgi:hypothetical protein